jgi:predicted nucleic acid-binding protein
VSDVWVVNASPIIALAKVSRLHLLYDLCDELLVPEAVVAEICAGPPSDPAKLAIQRGWGTTVTANRVTPVLLEWGLGAGETAVLAMAMERKPAATAILDDAVARTCAKALEIKVIGTVGVVLRAKKKSIIASAAEVIESLQDAGLRLDYHTIRSALEGIGETWKQKM